MANLMHTLIKPFFKYIIIGCLTTASLLHAQENNSIPSIEKIYLHSDRINYILGESLWYKAYSVSAYNNIPFNESNILYVELISSDSKIIAQNKTRMKNGLGHGDFKLTDSIGVKAGVYQLRAYTNYSRNFDNDFVFKKKITVVDVFDKNEKEVSSGKLKSKKAQLESPEATQNKLDIQFFPEGGSLINNVKSTIAFKAVDANGTPIKIQGKIFNSKGQIVTFIGSIHDGIGKFELKPIKGEQYHAEITTQDGTVTKVSLPKVDETGYLLSIRKVNGIEVITINTNEETLQQEPDTSVNLVCTSRGVSYFEGTLSLKETSISIELPKVDLPEGINQITLYDANLKPQSERLVYIEKEQDFDVTLSTDKNKYKPQEKVTVNISSKTKTGLPSSASFSLSCTDLNSVKISKDYGTTISSYFLMESDIRGKIHNPSYYFDRKNLRRLQHLDL